MNASDVLHEIVGEAASQVYEGCVDEWNDPEDALEHLIENVTVYAQDVRYIAETNEFKAYCEEFDEDTALYGHDDMERAVVRYLWTKAHDALLPLIEARFEFVARWRELGDENIALQIMEDE